jgi:L-lactate dehydrogenase complex protein LldE
MNILGHAAWKDKQAGCQPTLPGEHIASFLLRRTGGAK